MRPSLIRSGAACFRALDRKGFQASGNRLGEGGRYAGSGRVRLGRPSPVGGPIRCPPPPPVRHALPAQVEAFTRPRSSPRRPAARGPCCRAGRPSARGRTKTVDKGSGNLRHATCPSASSGTPTERPPPLARHAATDRSSIEPDREGLGTKHALSPTASLPSGQAHQGLEAGADGLRQEVRPRCSRRRPSRSCPGCSEQSTRRHSRYFRHLQDLPLQGVVIVKMSERPAWTKPRGRRSPCKSWARTERRDPMDHEGSFA